MYDVEGLADAIESGFADGRDADGAGARQGRREDVSSAIVRIDTPQEVLYYQHGGILQYVLRQLAGKNR